MLERWGCRPLSAGSLDEALQLVAASTPALVLSDLRLAGGASGIDAISALRARLGPLPAALVTGDIAADKLLEVRSIGLPLLHKPVRAADLLRMVIALARQQVQA
jgi:CheY-like chemotaxis protein